MHSKFRMIRGSFLFLILLFTIPILTSCTGTQISSSPVSPGEILIPLHDGTTVLQSDTATVDISHIEDGYFMAIYQGNAEKTKLQLTGPDGITYTYNMTADGIWDAFPFSAGNGLYTLIIYESMGDDLYFTSLAQELEVILSNDLLPFLYPNQFVNYTRDSLAVAKAEELTADCAEQLDMVKKIFAFTTTEIEYDIEKAESVTSGYLPDVDETLRTKKGICFDYAALMTCMLRSRGIPTKLQIGFSGEIKHAWISVHLDSTGWVDNIIQYDGTGWAMMDPTFASEMGAEEAADYIGDSTHYTLQYSR